MTGAEIGDPYTGLAARIALRAIEDCKGKIEALAGSELVRGLIQYDATEWLRSDPWFDALLVCLPSEYQGFSQEEIAKITIRKRKKSYVKHYSSIDMKALMSINSLSKITGIDRSIIYHAVHVGKLDAVKGGNNRWYSTLEELATALVAGDLKYDMREKHNGREIVERV